MTRLEAIDDLLEKVKTEKVRVSGDFENVWPKRHEHWDQDPAAHASAAYLGSTDAAIELCEAVLPDFTWLIRGADREDYALHQGKFLANIWNGNGNPNTGQAHYPVWSDTPARALLLAILEALKAQEGAQ